MSPSSGPARTCKFGGIVAIFTVGSIASTIAVLLRCYSRRILLRNFGYDDAAIVVAQVLTIATAVALGLEAHFGLGRHVWELPAGNYVPYMKAFYSSIVVYSIALSMVKISIVLQYRRIFPIETLQRVSYWYLVFLSLWTLTLMVMLPTSCLPVEAFWDIRGGRDSRCTNLLAIWYTMAGVNFLTDAILFLMPMPVIRSLQLPRLQKIMLVAIFGVGVFPLGVAIYRIPKLRAASLTTDPTYDNAEAATFSFLELSVGVVAACLPTIRPVLAVIMPRVFRSTIHTSHTSRQTDQSFPTPVGVGTWHSGGRDPYRVSDASVQQECTSCGPGSATEEQFASPDIAHGPGWTEGAECSEQGCDEPERNMNTDTIGAVAGWETGTDVRDEIKC